MAKKKGNWIDETWWGGWLIAGGLFGVAFIIAWLLKAKNPLSPIISIIGIVGIVVGGYFIYELLKKRSTENTQNKNKIKYISIATSVCALMLIVGMCSMTMELPSFSEKEKVIKDITFNGVDENSTPLAVSDLKLLKKGDTYTILGTLKKTSAKPEQSYFKFDVAMVDKNGKHIKEVTVDTMPYPFLGKENTPLFSYETSCHLEKEISISSSDSSPVNIEITNIREFDKTNFIEVILADAKEHMSKGYSNEAIKLLNKLLEYDTDNAEAKLLLEHISDPNYSPAPSSDETEKNVLIGTNKDNVRRLLSQYKEKKSLMGENAIDFDSNDLLVTVFFKDDVADGVAFLSNNLDDMNTITGEGSYVSKHYDELVAMASDDPNIKVESDLTKFNSQGNKKYAAELYIGNTPYDNQGSSEASASTTAPIPAQSSESQKATEKSEFSQCLSSGIVIGVKLYAKPSNDSYIGTITSISDDVLDERGKKTKAVYISGGKADGWYKRWDVGDLYVRNDDPNLPSGRYFAESMGVD